MMNTTTAYELITEDERQQIRESRGEDHAELMKGFRQKYFPKINAEFRELHPDNQRRLEDLYRAVDSVTGSLNECGDVWVNDLSKLNNSLRDLGEFMEGDVSYIKIGEPE